MPRKTTTPTDGDPLAKATAALSDSKAFVAWLKAHATEIVGNSNDPATSPLTRYLSEHAGRPVHAFGGTYRLPGDYHNAQALPTPFAWFNRQMRGWSGGDVHPAENGQPMTGAQALDLWRQWPGVEGEAQS